MDIDTKYNEAISIIDGLLLGFCIEPYGNWEKSKQDLHVQRAISCLRRAVADGANIPLTAAVYKRVMEEGEP